MSSPRCIGFIMDGNRRWAKRKGLSSIDGHKAGYENFKTIIDVAKEARIKELIFYVFSSENWKRKKEEVEGLLNLFGEALLDKEKILEYKTAVKFLGMKNTFSKTLQRKMENIEEETEKFTEGKLGIAISYGGRAEIIEATNKAIEKGEKVSEDTFNQMLWTNEFSDPDIIIRTGGEKRLSNFLPWQSVYSELYFTDTYWPAFSKEEFLGMLDDFSKRERRMGA